MTCPSCRAENEEQATTCFSCGAALGPSPSSVRLGSVVAARYEILALLGRGGMGVVYKAHDRTLDETVALKLLRPEVAGRAEMAQRFRAEIKLARKVRHENVCGIHEYGEDGWQRYIAMEFVDGVNLRHLIREGGGLSQREAFELSIQAALGLQAIHDAGIIHRDLKATNIMRDSQGLVRLMDFGIAKQHGTDVTIQGAISGTPDYMSPEQARGQPLDYRSDIYSLAVVIYELFTGRVPFKADTPVRTALKHLHEPPPLSGPLAERLPASVVPVLGKALAKQPAERYATAQEMAKALQEAQAAAGFEPAAREQALTLPTAGPLALAVPDPIPEVPGPTPVAAETIKPDVTATQPGPITVTELQPPEPPRPWARLKATAPQIRAGGRGGLVAWGGAALLLVVILWGWLGGQSDDPALTPVPAPVPSAPPEVFAEPGPRPAPAERPSPAAHPAPSASPGASRASAGRLPSGGARPAPPPLASTAAPPTPESPMSPVPPAPSAPPLDSTPAPEPARSPELPDPAHAPIALPASAVLPVPAAGNRPPEYPEALRAEGIEGQVFLKVVLSATGAVEDVKVLAGEPVLAEAAVAAARDWRFSPAMVGGQPTPVYLVVKVPFRAQER